MTTQALRQALVQHEAFVRELALVLTRNSAEADDVAQEVLLHTLERSPGAGAGLRAWLASSTRRIAWNLRRSERRRSARERRAARPEALSDPTPALAARQLLVDTVLALDEPFRRTIILAHEHGMTPGEIAVREGVPPSTVRTRLHRAHGLLRRQLEARGLGRSALSAMVAVGRVPALRVHTVASVVGAIALGTVAVVGVLAWTSRAHVEHGQAESESAVALERIADDPVAPLVASPARAERLAGVHAPLARVPALDEHPYWSAVRAAREKIARSVGETDVSLAFASSVIRTPDSVLSLGQSVVIDLSADSPIVGELVRALVGTGVHSLRVTETASKRAADREITVQQTSAGLETNLYDLLDLVVELAGPEIGWDVVDGTLWIATWDELAARGTSFEFALDDLLIVPADHGSQVPYPIFERAHGVAELRALLNVHLQQSFRSIDVVGTKRSLVVVHTPRVLREIQAWLDSFRAFRAPLPEAGVPGRTQRVPRSAGDERVTRALQVEGGPEHIVPEQGQSIMERWRRFGERHGVSVLWTSSALEIDAQRSAAIERGAPSDGPEWALRIEVCGGAVLVRAPHEPRSARSLSTAFFDLRLVLTGDSATPLQMERHPALARMAKDGRTLALGMQPFEDLVRTAIAPGTWDEDTRTAAIMSRCPMLLVRHSPWVLDDIEALVDVLR